MFKKRIVIAAIALGLSLPALSSASPLNWMPRLDVLGRIARVWELLPGMHPAPAARPAGDHRKNGPGLDPNGSTTGGTTSGSTTTTDPTSTSTGQ